MKIAHLSDLHFGTEEDAVVDSLLTALNTIEPDITVISGDFTQVAANTEFMHARKFMAGLKGEVLSVPGNHDIPPFSLLKRLTRPYARYKRHIDENLEPVFENEKLQLMGLNSSRKILPHWNWANGAVSTAQCEKVESYFKKDARWKILTLHHPVHKVVDMPINVAVFGRTRALQTFRRQNIDIVLTGHVHHASITTYGDENHQTIFLSASTALSKRLRGHENGFNVIHLSEDAMEIQLYALNEGTFKIKTTYRHAR